MPAESDSTVDATQADASTGSAQAGAGAQGKSAAAQTQQDNVADINLPEIIGVNAKRLLAGELNPDALLLANAAAASQRAIQNAVTLDAQLNATTMQLIQGAVFNTNRGFQAAVGGDGRREGNDEQTDKYEDIMKAIISSMVSGEWFKGNAAERMMTMAGAAAASSGAGASSEVPGTEK